MADDPLTWLQAYYLSLCDADWEHQYGFKIDNLDNPGWSLTFDLHETEMADRPFDQERIERSEHDWVYYSATNEVFTAHCGPQNLGEAISIFRAWVETGKPV